MRVGVDTLIPGFDLAATMGVAWVFSSSSSLYGCFVPCGFPSHSCVLIIAGPSPILYLFSAQNLAPPLVQPLSSSTALTLSSKLTPIYPLSFHSSPPSIMVFTTSAHQSFTTWGASLGFPFHKKSSWLTIAETPRTYLVSLWMISILLCCRNCWYQSWTQWCILPE